MPMRFLPLVAVMAASCLPAAAADALRFSLSQAYAGSLFQTAVSGSAQITTAGFSWDKALGSIGLSAGAEYSRLWRNAGLSALDLSLGADVVKTLGAKTALYLSLEGQAARFGSDFSDFDHTGGRLTAALKSYLSPSSILKATAASEYRAYSFSPFDFLSQGVSVSLDKYFASRTTLKAELSWGYKLYFHPWLASEAAADPAADVSAGGGILTPFAAWEGPGRGGPGGGAAGSSSGSGAGQSGSSGGGPGSPGSGRSGNGAAYAAAWRDNRSSGYALVSSTGGSRGIQTAAFNGIIAQGLGDRAGLRLAGIWRRTLSGGSPFSAVEEFAAVENPPYDAFAWQGWGWSAQTTALLPWNIERRLGYTWTDKEFPGIEALALDGLPLGETRRDRRGQIEARMEKTFAHCSVVLTAASLRNDSNDPLYAWRAPFVSLSLEWRPGPGKKKGPKA